MASKCNTILIFLIISSLALPSRPSTVEPATTPTPTPWPHQFHSLLVARNNGSLRIVDLWYDWPNGRNFNIIHHQLSYVLYDLEWNNGTSFFYTLDSSRRCSSMRFEVGILRPNWLDGANYLGQRRVDGFLCNVWEKVEFIWYYEDVITKRPVHWVFYDDLVKWKLVRERPKKSSPPPIKAPRRFLYIPPGPPPPPPII